MNKNALILDILEGIGKGEVCLLCYLWEKNEKRLMFHFLQNEAVMDPVFRDKVTDSKGFCNHHMHLLYETAYGGRGGDTLGYALYMQSVVERFLRGFDCLPIGDLKALSNNIFDFRSKSKQKILDFSDRVEYTVQGQRPCPACESLLSSDRVYLETSVEMLDGRKFEIELKSFRGLCLPHFMSSIKILSQIKVKYIDEVANKLVEVEKGCFKLLFAYLSEFIRKRKWDYRNEPAGAEVNANLIALKMLTGIEGLYCKSYRNSIPQESNR